MVSESEVLNIAELARLAFEGEDLQRFTKEFNAILEYVNTLSEVDVTEVEPMSHVHGVTNVFREDEPVPEMTTSEALSNAPDTLVTSIRVPIIIEPGTQ